MIENKNYEKEYQELTNDFHVKLLNISLVITFVSFLIEVIYYPLCLKAEMVLLPFGDYVIMFIIRPTVINLIAYFVAKYSYKKHEAKKRRQTMVPINLIIFICANTVITHAVFGSLYAIYVIPILLTIIYGDIILTKKILLNTIAISIISYYIISIDPYTVHADIFLFNVALSLLLMFISYLIAVAIIKYEHKKEEILIESFVQNAKLEDEANHDGLTKLYNHNAFEKILEENLNNKSYRGLQLAIIDIDFFKRVNDTYGHEAGNVVLVKFAELIKRYENNDIKPARYGGEEFAMIFNGLTSQEAYSIIDKLKTDMSMIRFPELNNENITFSAGIAEHIDELTMTELIKKTDEALYFSKKNGRNQINIA